MLNALINDHVTQPQTISGGISLFDAELVGNSALSLGMERGGDGRKGYGQRGSDGRKGYGQRGGDGRKGYGQQGDGRQGDGPSMVMGGTWPMTVKDVVFVLKNISQSSPFPCDENNIISVTLATNVPLPLACKPVITISGLAGSFTEDNDELPLMRSSASKFGSSAKWTMNG
jgi:hypothetical protein